MLLTYALATALTTASAGVQYGERMNQLDLRFGKLLKIGPTKSVISLDLYNALNSNAVLTENATYRDTTQSGWRIPTSIAPPRLLKVSLQLDF